MRKSLLSFTLSIWFTLPLLCLLLIPTRASAQAHSAALTWTLSTDDTTTTCAVAGTTCTQNVYRAPGACASASTFTLLGSANATTVTFNDATITPGTYCYAVTFVLNGSESVKTTAQVLLPPAPPLALIVVAK
jgi:hypothetical protein